MVASLTLLFVTVRKTLLADVEDAGKQAGPDVATVQYLSVQCTEK